MLSHTTGPAQNYHQISEAHVTQSTIHRDTSARYKRRGGARPNDSSALARRPIVEKKKTKHGRPRADWPAYSYGCRRIAERELFILISASRLGERRVEVLFELGTLLEWAV